jgi:hypothetical protein
MSQHDGRERSRTSQFAQVFTGVVVAGGTVTLGIPIVERLSNAPSPVSINSQNVASVPGSCGIFGEAFKTGQGTASATMWATTGVSCTSPTSGIVLDSENIDYKVNYPNPGNDPQVILLNPFGFQSIFDIGYYTCGTECASDNFSAWDWSGNAPPNTSFVNGVPIYCTVPLFDPSVFSCSYDQFWNWTQTAGP